MVDMRTRASRYSNPRLGVAFESLADVFAPPGGSDVYGYTKAAGEKQRQVTLADIVARSKDPNTDRRVLDQLNAAVNNYAPNAGWIAVETKDATDRHKIGVDDARGRADFASRDATSRANNTDDNTRAVRVAGMTPIQKDAVQYLDPTVAAVIGAQPGVRRGIVSAQPGERNVLPGGEVIEGAPKPLTETEMNAIVMRDEMDKEERRAKVFGNTPVVETGKGPMTRPQQLATGTPKLDPTQPQAFNSSRGPVVWDPVKRAYVPAPTADGANISGGLQSPSGVQSKDPLGATTANQTDANSKEASLNVLDALVNDYEKLLQDNAGVAGVPGKVRDFAQNAVSVVQEFGVAFGNTPLDSVITPDQAQQFGARLGAGSRDPAIAKARIMQADLAYKWAQTQNPRGEVSRQAYERAINALSGGSLPNNQSVLEGLAAVRDYSKRERIGVESLRRPGGAPAAGTPTGPRVLQTPAGNVTIEPVQ